MTASVVVGRVGTHPDGEPVDYEAVERSINDAAAKIAATKAVLAQLAAGTR